ncbi:uncharacterized protein LOC126838184 [Adelges cooleyi]|uniref:uncharacterized protein LOC126838184 n=1 Tax=Adelges cooleyi TaxID=133065 RepID=UPI00217FCC73|nr:uncharacterized protein LOC126838184 [Adelges cooleyi]XP_050428331.1 uncharacterized protein LOC126838184 [Adelges cooleyi]
MAVLKLWYVLLFFRLMQFIYGSYGNEEKEIENCKNLLLNLQHLATGYSYQPNRYERESLKDQSLGQLQKSVANLYDELECGYYYSAQLHLKLTGYAVFRKDKTIYEPKELEDFTFDQEATMMIYSLLDPKHDEVNDLWLIYIYARLIKEFYRRLRAVLLIAVNANVYKKNKRLHYFVLNVINKRVKRCKLDNSFNIKSEKCEHRSFVHELLEKKQFCCSLVKKDTTKTLVENCDAVMNAIKRNKQLLHENFKENRDKKLLEFSMTETISYELLLFKDERICKMFFGEFLAANPHPVDLSFPVKLSDIRSLGKYQRRVIGTLKIIMLQITLSFIDYVINSLDSLEAYKKFKDDSLEACFNFKYTILGEFKDLMVLNHDLTFNEISESFQFIFEHKSNSDEHADPNITDYQGSLSHMKRKITRLIKYITRKNKLPNIRVTVTDSEQCKTLSDVHNVGIRFVEKIKSHIGKHSIRLVQSFLKMIDEKNLPRSKKERSYEV